MEFHREDLAAALTELGELTHGAGKVIDIAIYGGSCLMLASNFRVATKDVDAVALSDQSFIDEAARTIAARHGWPENWLNDGVRTYLSPLAEGLAEHELFRTYPSEARPGLRVFVPSAGYMLAMKLMALRIDPATEEKDLQDILHLMSVCGLRGKDEILAFAARFYPEARVSAKLALAIDDLWQLHQRRDKLNADEPPTYPERGRPPRA